MNDDMPLSMRLSSQGHVSLDDVLEFEAELASCNEALAAARAELERAMRVVEAAQGAYDFLRFRSDDKSHVLCEALREWEAGR